jgi:hypothetical protein
MIINTKNIGSGSGKSREEIANEFLRVVTPEEASPNHNTFIGKINKDDEAIYKINIPKGSWDIMGAVVHIILKYVPGDIVEIGMGESTQVLSAYAKEYGVSLYSCDLRMGGMFRVFDKELFENHHCYIGKSEDFIKEYGGYPRIVFIDGEHLSETVRMEVEFFLPRILPGGVMLLHDTMPVFKKSIERDDKGYNPGDIYKVRQELERMPEYDVFTWPYSAVNMGLTMVMVHGTERPYWRQNGRIQGE